MRLPFLARPLCSAAVAALLLALPACDGSPTAAEEPAVEVRNIILRSDGGEFIYSHTEHWHGAPVIQAGAGTGFTVYLTATALTADDHDMPPVESWFTLAQHPGYNVRAVIEDPTLATWTGDRDRGTLQGLREGASRISFVVRRGTTTIYEAPPLNFRVQPAGR